VDYSTAKDSCDTKGGQLATFNSKEKIGFMNDLLLSEPGK